MSEQSSVEAFGATFKFEPPVPLRDDQDVPVTALEKLAIIAWYGTELPYGLAGQTCEEAFLTVFEDLEYNPQRIAQRVTAILQDKNFVVTVE